MEDSIQLREHCLGDEILDNTSQQVLDSFEQLSEAEKQQVAAEILRRTMDRDIPPLSDEELNLCAEAVFLSLDEDEAEDEQQYTESR